MLLLKSTHQRGNYTRIFCTLPRLLPLPHSTIPPSVLAIQQHRFLVHHLLSNSITDLDSLHRVHAHIITSGNSTNIFLAAKLISLYSQFANPKISTQLFNAIPSKDTFLWNSIIKSHFSHDLFEETLEFYLRMRISTSPPNHFTFPMVVSACAELSYLREGRNFHGIAVRTGTFVGNPAVGSSFVYMYARCGEMGDAHQVFDEMSPRDVVSWTALIVGYVQNRNIEKALIYLQKMHADSKDDVRPNFRTIEVGFQACASLEALQEGKCLHGFVLKTGIGCSHFVISSILSMYSKCGNVEEASLSFDELLSKDLISWTAIIGVYAKKGYFAECFYLFQTMQLSGINPDGIVVSCLLMACSNSLSFYQGKFFHGLIIRRKLESEASVSNSLLLMYCRFQLLDIAQKLFDRMVERDSESWNCMVSGYARMGGTTKCIELFREMQVLAFKSDSNSLISVLSICSRLVAMRPGMSVHCYIIKFSIGEDVSVANSLVDMYGKCGNLIIARRIFSRMDRDIISWNTIIGASAHSGLASDAFALFKQMQLENVKPNSATFVSVLPACSHLAAVEDGERIHRYIQRTGLECDVSLGTALVDMYAKCGDLRRARELFDLMPERDVISWNVMIAGYGIHGNARDAIEIFLQMEELGVKPNNVTFLAVLSACSHAGLVKEGREFFGKMKIYSVIPNVKHYACMVDLLGRAGYLCEAEALIRRMPIAPDSGVWGALLGSCGVHGNIEMAERVAEQVFKLDPENDGYYILMANMYSSARRWEEAGRVRGMMKERGVKKRPGWSSVGLSGEVNVFFVGDKSHPQSEEIYAILETLIKQMEELGYVPKIESVLSDVELKDRLCC